ncbi:hypothetical protein ABPG72_011055 [Tetrahymena utriculariae]
MINKLIKTLALYFVAQNCFVLEVLDECPQMFQLGSVSTTCSTDVSNSQLRNSFLINSSSQNNQYLVVFAIQSVSFYTTDNLSLLKYIQLQNKVNLSNYVQGKGLQYVSNQGIVYVLNESTYNFDFIATFHSSYVVSSFALCKNLDYLVYINNLSQLMIFSQDEGQSHISDNFKNFLFNIMLNFVAFKVNDENFYIFFLLKKKRFGYDDLFSNSKQVILADQYFIVQYESQDPQGVFLSIYEGKNLNKINEFEIILNHLPQQISQKSTITIKSAKFMNFQNEQKKLYIYGNNLFLARIDCNNNEVITINQQIDLNSIDTRDSDYSNIITDLSITQLYGQIQDIDLVSENIIAFTILNYLILNFNDMIVQKDVLITNDANNYIIDSKIDPKYKIWNTFWINGIVVQLNENNEKIIIVYGNSLFLMVVNTASWTAQIMQQDLSQQQIQQIDYKDSQYRQSNANSDQISKNLLSAAYCHGVIVTSSQNLIAAYDFVQQKFVMMKFQQDYYDRVNNGNSLANIIFLNENIFYILNSKALQMIDIIQSKIKFDTKCFIVEQILSIMSNIIYTDNDLDRLYLFDCGDFFIYLNTLQGLYRNSNFVFVAQQDNNYILYYYQTVIAIINLKDLSHLLLDLKKVSQSSFLQNQNELINFSSIDSVNDLLYFITSKSSIYKLKLSNLLNQGIIYQQNTLSKSITFTRINSQQQIWISSKLFIIQLQEQFNNQLGISIQFSSDNSIMFFVYDTINDIKNNNMTVILLSSKGTLYHYQGNNIVFTQQLYYQTTSQGLLMDNINMCALSYSLDGNIINYNYKKRVVQMQWQSGQMIHQIKIDQIANRLILTTIMSTIFVKDYSMSQFYAQNQDNQGFNGGVTDVTENIVIAYNKQINFYKYPSLNLIKSYQHNPQQTSKFSNILNLQIISEIDTLISYSDDGSISIYPFSTMNYVKTVIFDQKNCDYPIGGSFYQSKVQLFIRCNGGSIYLLDAQNFSFKIIQPFNHILNVWKVTQILIVEQLDKIYFVGYCYWVQEYKLRTLTFNQLHQGLLYNTIKFMIVNQIQTIGVDGRYDYYNNLLLLFDQNCQIYIFDSFKNEMIRFQAIHVSWIYDLAINYQNQQFVSCGIDGTLQLKLYNMTDLSKRVIYTHYQSWKSLLYDQEANILSAFDIEGKIFLFNFNTLQLRKKILRFSGQITNPFIDFNTNMQYAGVIFNRSKWNFYFRL